MSVEPENDSQVHWGWAQEHEPVASRMDALIREAAELAYTTHGLHSGQAYAAWKTLPGVAHRQWCLAIEAALAYAIQHLFVEGPPDAP